MMRTSSSLICAPIRTMSPNFRGVTGIVCVDAVALDLELQRLALVRPDDLDDAVRGRSAFRH